MSAGIRVRDMNGLPCLVSITKLGGAAVSVYSDEGLTTLVAMPTTIAVNTTFFMAQPDVYSISVNIYGVEVGTSGNLEVPSGKSASISVGDLATLQAIAGQGSSDNATYAPIATTLTQATATARYGRSRLVSIAQRNNTSTGFSNGIDTGGTARVQHYLYPGVDASGIRLLYTNFTGQFGGPSVLTVRASVQYGGVAFQVTFNGSRTGTLDPSAPYLLSDPLPIDVTYAPNNYLFSRTYVSCPAAGQFPIGLTLSGGAGEGNNYTSGAGGADLTGAGYYTTPANTFGSGTNAFSPTAILGTPNQATACVLGVGDSVMFGTGDDAGQPGYLARKLNTANIPYITLARFGEQGAAFNSSKAFRLAVAQFCTHVVEGYGDNDFAPSGGNASLALLQSSMLGIWFSLARQGLKVWRVSILPRTTSTDAWATIGNQTVGGNDAARTGFNDWLRAGAPISPTTLAAVAIGTGGALVMGVTGHPLTGYFEIADLVETSRNSGVWKAPGYTTDGIHPNGNAHVLIGTNIDTTKFTV